MKKLFLLPAVLLGLVACGQPQQPAGPSVPTWDNPYKAPAGALSITREGLGLEQTNSYPSKTDPLPMTATIGGIEFGFDGHDVLGCSDKYETIAEGEGKDGLTGSWYCYGVLDAFQFRANTKTLVNKAAISGKTKMTVVWFATYATEATQYFPTLQAGTEADDLTSVTANERDTATGTKVEGFHHVIGSKPTKSIVDVWVYKTTFNLGSNTFFKIGAGTSASVIHEIFFE